MEVVIHKGILLCPICGTGYLHQIKCEAFWRTGEDEVSYVHKSSSQSHCKHEDFTKRNPSKRRDGLILSFSCEHCDADPQLSIYQHQGETLIAWHSLRQLVNGGVK